MGHQRARQRPARQPRCECRRLACGQDSLELPEPPLRRRGSNVGWTRLLGGLWLCLPFPDKNWREMFRNTL